MNLFKRTTASIALVALVSGVFSTGVSAYDVTELNAAAALAAKGYINTQSNVADYNLDATITRAEIAKVAANVAGLSASTTCMNKFADVSATTPNNWVCGFVEALLAGGLISANANYNPNANLTKAEAVKLMLTVAGEEVAFEAATWQADFVSYAVENGFVSSFSDYNTAATRGFTFSVAAAATTEEEGDDILSELDKLLGDTDEDDMTDDSTDTPVMTGDSDLEISLNPSSVANGTQIPNSGTVRFAKVDITSGDSDASVNTISVKSLGLASVPTGTRVWFEKGGKRLSGKAAFSSDRTAVVSFAPAYVVKAGSTETLEFFVELNATAGNDFQFSGEIASSSATNGGTFTTSTLRTATYAVVTSDFKKLGSNSTYNQSEDNVELGRFSVENQKPGGVTETRDVTLENITLRQLGNGDLTSLSELVLERNGVVVSDEVNVSSKDVTFVLNDTIKDASTATYYIKAVVSDVENNAGDTYQFSLRNSTDMSSIEDLNGFRSTISINGGVKDLSTYTVNGSDIIFARDTSVDLSRNYAKGTSDVVLMKGTITSKSAITLEDLALDYQVTGSALNADADDLFDTLYIKIGSSVMTWSATAAGQATFSGLANINGSTEVKLYGKLKDSAPAKTIKFADLRLSSFTTKEYVVNQNDVTTSVGSISAVSVSVDSTSLNITRVDGLGNTNIAVGSKGVTLYGLNLAVTQGNPVSVSNAEFTVTNGVNATQLNNVFATLYVDGVAVSTKTINAATVKFDNLTKTVNAASTKIEVKADLSDAFAAGELILQLTALDVVDTLTSQNVAFVASPASATFTIAQAVGTLSSSDNNPQASLLLAGEKDQKVLAFRVKAQNDNVSLRDLNFTGTNLSNLSNFRIINDSNTVVAIATTVSNTALGFTNITTEDKIMKDKTNTYYIIADVNTNVSGATFDTTLVVATSNIKSTNGTIITMAGANVVANTHAIEENRAVVAKAANGSKQVTTSALRFSVTATGKDSVTLTQASFANLFAGYTTAAAKIVVYKDSISAANKLGETVAGTVTGNVALTGKNTVDAGSTNNYIVVVEGIVVDGAANSQDWSVSLSDLTVSGVSSNAYDNLGDFPITETK